MKRLISLFLVLCFALFSIPAFAEDFSGSWYYNIEKAYIGQLDLNSDGSGNLSLFGEKEPITWYAAPSGIVMKSSDGMEATFEFDSSNNCLFNNKEELRFYRDKGDRIDISLILGYLNGESVDLPAGISTDTIEDIVYELKSIIYENDEDQEDEPPFSSGYVAEEANVEVNIVSDNFFVADSYGSKYAFYFAKIVNDTDNPYFVTDGMIVLKNAAGEKIGSSEYLYQTGSLYLEPGETTFVSMQAEVESDDDVADYNAMIIGSSISYSSEDYAIPVESTEIGLDKYGYFLPTAKIVNDTDEEITGIQAVLALKDKDDHILYVQEIRLREFGLCAHSAINIRDSISSDVFEYLRSNNIEPASVEAYAWVETED